MTPRLVTVPFSHYCEKARWALDYARVAYVEDPHLPMLHWMATFRAGGGRTVPMLVTADGVLPDSTDIVRYADRAAATNARRLLPDDRHDRALSEALEDDLDEWFGPAVRRVGYFYAFGVREIILQLGETSGAPWWERRTLAFALPFVRTFMLRTMAIDERTVEESRDVVRRTFDRMATLLRDGRRYLTGDAFGTADLTFAALGAPMVRAPEHPIVFPAEHASPGLEATWREFRAHPAGRFILRLYADHRHDTSS